MGLVLEVVVSCSSSQAQSSWLCHCKLCGRHASTHQLLVKLKHILKLPWPHAYSLTIQQEILRKDRSLLGYPRTGSLDTISCTKLAWSSSCNMTNVYRQCIQVGAFFTSIPVCVLGGMTTFLFAGVCVSGIKVCLAPIECCYTWKPRLMYAVWVDMTYAQSSQVL